MAAPFPSDFPPNCPPSEAVSAAGPVFRIVTTNPFTASDFKSYEEANLQGGTPCRRRAVSVYPTLRQAMHHRNLQPHLGDFVAEGTFRPETGVTKLTNPSTGHTAWWPPKLLDRTSLFGGGVHPCPEAM